MGKTALQRLYAEQGQAPWLDSISRGMIRSGELRRMIDTVGILGVTSNPTIFAQAITSGADYDAQLNEQTLFAVILQDIAAASDLFRGVYERANPLDGYVSIEVTPDVAHDTDRGLDQAR